MCSSSSSAFCEVRFMAQFFCQFWEEAEQWGDLFWHIHVEEAERMNRKMLCFRGGSPQAYKRLKDKLFQAQLDMPKYHRRSCWWNRSSPAGNIGDHSRKPKNDSKNLLPDLTPSGANFMIYKARGDIQTDQSWLSIQCCYSVSGT